MHKSGGFNRFIAVTLHYNLHWPSLTLWQIKIGKWKKLGTNKMLNEISISKLLLFFWHLRTWQNNSNNSHIRYIQRQLSYSSFVLGDEEQWRKLTDIMKWRQKIVFLQNIDITDVYHSKLFFAKFARKSFSGWSFSRDFFLRLEVGI